ncbi:hypothetical protein PFLmoz3_00790 [Pseudomonas fluorescens]|uniref:Uncharacterized protein n=1 Tax=Pseudomonas fluorescens TaxID=294 RepID=A0A109LLB2_PSEFL|nr:hypothetical protein PFLmoz3_00790 [Pseudomonas fluorescens]
MAQPPVAQVEAAVEAQVATILTGARCRRRGTEVVVEQRGVNAIVPFRRVNVAARGTVDIDLRDADIQGQGLDIDAAAGHGYPLGKIPAGMLGVIRRRLHRNPQLAKLGSVQARLGVVLSGKGGEGDLAAPHRLPVEHHIYAVNTWRQHVAGIEA